MPVPREPTARVRGRTGEGRGRTFSLDFGTRPIPNFSTRCRRGQKLNWEVTRVRVMASVLQRVSVRNGDETKSVSRPACGSGCIHGRVFGHGFEGLPFVDLHGDLVVDVATAREQSAPVLGALEVHETLLDDPAGGALNEPPRCPDGHLAALEDESRGVDRAAGEDTGDDIGGEDVVRVRRGEPQVVSECEGVDGGLEAVHLLAVLHHPSTARELRSESDLSLFRPTARVMGSSPRALASLTVQRSTLALPAPSRSGNLVRAPFDRLS